MTNTQSADLRVDGSRSETEVSEHGGPIVVVSSLPFYIKSFHINNTTLTLRISRNLEITCQ